MCWAGASSSTSTARCVRPRTRTATSSSTFSHHGAPLERLTVVARGEIETSDAAGVVRGAIERLPAEMYLRESPLAQRQRGVARLRGDGDGGRRRPARRPAPADERTAAAMAFDPYKADDPDSAVEAFALRRGRARDFAHIFIACARFLNLPARFIRGYRAADEAGGEAGAHAWAEAYAPRPRLGRLRRDRLPLRRRHAMCASPSASTPRTRPSSAAPTGRRGRGRDGDQGRAGGRSRPRREGRPATAISALPVCVASRSRIERPQTKTVEAIVDRVGRGPKASGRTPAFDGGTDPRLPQQALASPRRREAHRRRRASRLSPAP